MHYKPMIVIKLNVKDFTSILDLFLKGLAPFLLIRKTFISPPLVYICLKNIDKKVNDQNL